MCGGQERKSNSRGEGGVIMLAQPFVASAIHSVRVVYLPLSLCCQLLAEQGRVLRVRRGATQTVDLYTDTPPCCSVAEREASARSTSVAPGG